MKNSEQKKKNKTAASYEEEKNQTPFYGIIFLKETGREAKKK